MGDKLDDEKVIVSASTVSGLAVGALGEHDSSGLEASETLCELIFYHTGNTYHNVTMLKELLDMKQLTLEPGSMLDVILTRFINTLQPITKGRIDSIAKDMRDIYSNIGDSIIKNMYDILVDTLKVSVKNNPDDKYDEDANVFSLTVPLYISTNNTDNIMSTVIDEYNSKTKLNNIRFRMTSSGGLRLLTRTVSSDGLVFDYS